MSRYPDEEKRRRILQVSYETFGEIGYKRTTIKHVADKVGIAPGTIYTYFQDKDALFMSSINDVWDQFCFAVDQAVDNTSKPYEQRAKDLFEMALTLIRKAHRLLAGVFIVAARRELLKKNLDRVCRSLVPFFQEGRTLGWKIVDSDLNFAYYQIKIMLSGILWDLALVDENEIEAELNQVRHVFLKELGSITS